MTSKLVLAFVFYFFVGVEGRSCQCRAKQDQVIATIPDEQEQDDKEPSLKIEPSFSAKEGKQITVINSCSFEVELGATGSDKGPSNNGVCPDNQIDNGHGRCFWYFKDYVLQTALKDFIWRMIRLQYLVIILIGLAMAISLFAMDLEDSDFFSVSNDALSGSFMEASYYRLIDGAPYLVLSTISFIPQALAVFGLGYLAEHAGFFRENSESFQKLKALLPKLLIGGLVCNVVYAVGISEISDNGLWLGVGILLWLVGAPALSAVYLYYLIIIARRIQLPEIFILAGRNSLSVYVLQGIIASLMFGGYGLGWFGEFGELALIPVGIGIYFVTVVIVGLYAKRFGRGFLEPILRGISG